MMLRRAGRRRDVIVADVAALRAVVASGRCAARFAATPNHLGAFGSDLDRACVPSREERGSTPGYWRRPARRAALARCRRANRPEPGRDLAKRSRRRERSCGWSTRCTIASAMRITHDRRLGAALLLVSAAALGACAGEL